ncbi:AAA family ATPase [Synechococcus sp. PCC 6312]|uniref:AAA family ATPase n=1 Tax=Synechococcus sp. (strain ATCC 27167 / PCC 6312) TaxID=195253 RepID=UPI00029F229F|nr:AAA family ATPase [Synechococcus sp. PCC 6312]AFY60326.1 ATPase family protein associated with various cellular activities (AAA) [Synechococcus sp. PCC 6312]
MQNIAITKNLKRFQGAFGDLIGRSERIPGLGLVTGPAGTGKTVAATHICHKQNAIYVLADPFWTASSMLGAILHKLSVNPGRVSNAEAFRLAVERMRDTGRSLLVDDADFLFDSSDRNRLVEGLRSLHDKSQQPVIMIGMEKIRSKLHRYPQVLGRMSRSVDFEYLDLEDTRAVLEVICKVSIAPDLSQVIHQRTKGALRLIVVAAETIEAEATAQGWEVVTADQWGDAVLFTGDSRRAA